MSYLNGSTNINNSNNVQFLNLLNNYYLYYLMKIIEEKAQFKILKKIGLNEINNTENIIHYLFNNINNN